MATRSRGAQAFEHVLFTVLGLFDDTPLVLALNQEGYESIADLATMTDAEIEEIKYQVKDIT